MRTPPVSWLLRHLAVLQATRFSAKPLGETVYTVAPHPLVALVVSHPAAPGGGLA